MPPCPWGAPSGLKCPPVLIPSPELQSPCSCRGKPCGAPGFRPDPFAFTRTMSPSWVNVTLPRASLPLVGSRSATAVGPPPMPIDAQPATAKPTHAARMMRFIASPESGLLRVGLLGLFLLLFRFSRGGAGFLGRGSGGRHRLRNRLAGLLHVALEILHRLVFRGGLVGLRLLGGGRVLRLLLLGGGLALLVERRRGRNLRPGGTASHGKRDRESR